MLGMKLEEESDNARAARIRERLKNEKESTLIILDDLWAALDFNLLGIPLESDGERSSSYKGCKVLLISESKQVLLSQMEGKENSIYSLGVLKEKEAETLFKKKAGISDSENFEFEKLATQIASKCNGLPTTIITTARALKIRAAQYGRTFINGLKNKTLIAASEFSTKLSYELLESKELKDTFLLCARLGQDALIMDLVKYCIGLGFLEGIYTIREARSRVYAWLEA
ncbi:P-loop containing nucleoside triphosphate hydrolase [Sesbania bispinosa]|nr:P-loop containing nucleoside triphosphate hydrolase [Sesbania bispinosa]